MLRNYIIIAWRSLKKNKLFSFINIFGLAMSMCVCMMVMVRLFDALSFDTFHPYPDRTYRIISEINNLEGDQWTIASTPLPLRETLANDTNVFASVASIYPAIRGNASDGVKEIYVNGAFTQPEFFDVFGFSLASGDPLTALREPNSILLSHNTAKKFFRDDNPVGKLITFEKLGVFKVTGVLKEVSGKSHINYDVFISASSVQSLEKSHKLPARYDTWDSFEYAYTYVVLNKNIRQANLYSALEQLNSQFNKESQSGRFYFTPQALSAITPHAESLQNDIGNGSSWMKITIEVGVAMIILFAAAFNYTNLSIARSLTRTREVGIRKVAGARRSQIFAQYLIESVLVALFALCFALGILSFILEFKPFNDGYEFMPDVKIDIFLIICFVLFALFAGALAGVIPAWILSSFRAVKMLKNVAVEKIMGGLTLRKVLIVFQFSLSLVILIFLSAFYRQFSFMANAETGYKRKNIISIPFSGKELQTLKTEILRVSGVEDIGALSGNFGKYTSGVMSVSLERSQPEILKVPYYFADEGVLDVMGLKLLAGSNFTSVNTTQEKEIILNHKAIEVLGFTSASAAVGEKIWIDDTTEVVISGVISDFYNNGVGNAITPLALRNNSASVRYLNVQVNAESAATIIPGIEQVWKKIFPDRVFTYVWLDKQHRENHDQTATISLLGFLAFMTVAIASLGLLGLVVYTVETRRKEISIRKIIGASVRQLVTLLSEGFSRMLLIAGLIALPTGFALSKLFLTNFANKVDFGVGSLVFCFIFLLVIGLTMIVSQTYKASIENPVDSLRSE